MKANIFKDAAMEALYDTQGFVIIKGFLQQTQLEALDAYFEESYPRYEPKYNFFATTYIQDIAFRKEISSKVFGIHKPSIDALFRHYKSVGSTYILKEPGDDSRLDIHQDFSLFDEEKFESVNVWCPLVDVNEVNGYMSFIPYSQHFSKVLRNASILAPYDRIKAHMEKALVSISIERGDAIMFNPSCMHYSSPNLSGKLRIVSDSSIVHQDAQVRSYFKDAATPEGMVEEIAHSDDFLLEYTDFRHHSERRPLLGKTLGLVPYAPHYFSEAEFDSQLQKHSGKVNTTPFIMPQP